MAAANFQTLVILSHNLDRAIPAIVLEIRRAVGERVLAAEIILNLSKCIGHIGKLERLERASSGSIGNSLQDLIAAASTWKIGADRVNDDIGAKRHFNGFLAGDVAGIVLAIGDQNNRTPCRFTLR